MPEPFDDLPPYDPLEHADIIRKRNLEDGRHLYQFPKQFPGGDWEKCTECGKSPVDPAHISIPGPKLVMRLRWKQLGGHFHCRVFTAKASGLTYANCGQLVFDEREWRTVKAAFARIAEMLPEET